MNQVDRIESLDGLRGVACLVVLLMHLGYTVKPWGGEGAYALIPGNEAVLVFFVLSGVVLAIGPLSKKSSSEYGWYGYFPRRVVRLMVPLFVAMVLGVASVIAAQLMGLSTVRGALETITMGSGVQVFLHDIITQFDFFFSDADRANPPAWSMKWELWFSLVLPLCVYLVERTRRTSVALCVLVVALFISYYAEYPAIHMCLMFIFGVYLAKHLELLRALRLSGLATLVILLVSILFIELPELQRMSFGTENAFVQSGISILRDIGCVALVILAINRGVVGRFLSTKPCLFFGKLSYSLYLTHAIVVAGLHSVLNICGLSDPMVQCAVIILMSLVIAYGFWILVENPSIEWSRKIGQDAMVARCR